MNSFHIIEFLANDRLDGIHADAARNRLTHELKRRARRGRGRWSRPGGEPERPPAPSVIR